MTTIEVLRDAPVSKEIEAECFDEYMEVVEALKPDIDSTSLAPSIVPTRILYTMLRVSNLEKSIAFYRDMLGMRELGRETFPDVKFTAVFMGYGDRKTDAVLELTYNWGEHSYDVGTGFGNISLEVEDVYALETYLMSHGVEILRPAGEVPIVSTELGKNHTLAFIADPDGYRIELMEPS